MFKRLSLFFIIFVGLSLVITAFSFAQPSEQITITTYYPSPYGVYKNLRLDPYAVAAGGACTVGRGTLAYANAANGNQPLYCDGSNWKAMAGGVSATQSYTAQCSSSFFSGITCTATNMGTLASHDICFLTGVPASVSCAISKTAAAWILTPYSISEAGACSATCVKF